VVIKLRLGFFEVAVLGSKGEYVTFLLPLRHVGSDPGCKGLMVANFTTASVGLIDSIALVGPLRRPALAVDILARGTAPCSELSVPLAVANSLLLGEADANFPPLDLSASTEDVPPLSEVAAAQAALPPPVMDMLGPVVRDTVWPANMLSPPLPRRSSRLASVESANFISIVDKAVLRKKMLNEGSSTPRRHGELVVEDLLAVALEDSEPMHPGDVAALAVACDIELAELQPGSSVTAGLP
jgi:hypothetical protein